MESPPIIEILKCDWSRMSTCFYFKVLLLLCLDPKIHDLLPSLTLTIYGVSDQLASLKNTME